MSAHDDEYEISTAPAGLAGTGAEGAARPDDRTTAWIHAERLAFHEPRGDAAAVLREAERITADGRQLTAVVPRTPRPGSLEGQGVPVATFATFTKSLNVGGGHLLPAHLVAGVTVQPTHRRRGILRRMMTADLQRAADAGLAVAALTASEATIYRRFGFGSAMRERTVTVDRSAPVSLLRGPGADRSGTVELVAATEVGAIAREVFAAFHAVTPGSIDRHEGVWPGVTGLGSKPEGGDDDTVRAAVHRDADGVADGCLTYRVVELPQTGAGGGSGQQLQVVDLVAATDEAHLDLWELLLSIDLVDSVRYPTARVDDPLLLALANGRALSVTHEEDHVWFRLLDAPAAFGARPYAADGSVTLRVHDALGHVEGTWRLTSAGGTGSLDPVTGAGEVGTASGPDVELDVADLGSAWLGGVDVGTLRQAGLLREHRTGAVQELRAMLLPERAPYGITYF
ncbi:GNAT family N-acetyltransferase [Frigoribacterium salinisoli]